MKLLEYEGKQTLAKYGVPVPRSYLAGATPDWLPVVLKAQVPVGGRGKAGGIQVVKTESEYTRQLANIKKLSIKGHIADTVLAEQLLDIKRELYLAALIDKPTASIVLMAHVNGGVEVEDNDADDFLRIPLTSDNLAEAGLQLSEYYDAPQVEFTLQELVQQLYTASTKGDMTLLEINPLVITSSDELIAGDAKIVLDDSAAFRHPEWKYEDAAADVNFVTLDPHGQVATIANGAGLAMATVDAVADSGMTPANFLDIGGGASEASVLAAFERIMEYGGVKAIVINIFAGITRCDEVARAIIAAQARIKNLPPLTVRLAGTNYEQATELLQAAGVPLYPNLPSAITATKEHI